MITEKRKIKSQFLSLFTIPNILLVSIVILGFALRVGRINSFENEYYSAASISVLNNWHNFFFLAFDPVGLVTVDKPPLAIWIQSVPVFLFGYERWLVNFPQVIFGTLSIILIYKLLKPEFGNISAFSAAAILSTMPSLITVDSRNEPDSLLIFLSLLATYSVIKMASSNKLIWIIVFTFTLGAAFTTKGLVAFIPLPIFIFYYLLIDNKELLRKIIRIGFTVILLTLFSFIWIIFVALTPSENRPYIGSTEDNSIWSLTFKHNGFDRFNKFGPPAGPIGPPPPGMIQNNQQLPLQPGLVASNPRPPNVLMPPPRGIGNNRVGILEILYGRLGSQTGYFLIVALILGLMKFGSLLDKRDYKDPISFLSKARKNPNISQTFLLYGWLLTGFLVFGSANATSTHPYYLADIGVPIAAVLGISIPLLLNIYRQSSITSFIVPFIIIAVMMFQLIEGGYMAGQVISGFVLIITLISSSIVLLGCWKKTTDTKLATWSIFVSTVALLIIPLMIGWNSGGRIAGPGVNINPQLPSPRDRLGPPPQFDNKIIKQFFKNEIKEDSDYLVATLRANTAASLIIDQIPVVAIGGFSGRDPIFTVKSFENFVYQKELKYFLMRENFNPINHREISNNNEILESIKTNWEDISIEAGLPPGLLYKFPE
jgi:4-amino-4-deoxy-L-arabinose transferase-like glycosyltransferase